MEKLFHLKENGTNVKTEVMAGITTFLSLIHISMRFQRIRYRRSVMLRAVGGVVIRQRLRHALCIRQRARCLMLLRILHGGGKQRCDQRHNGDDINAHPGCRSADDCARMRRNGRITVLLQMCIRDSCSTCRSNACTSISASI